MNYKIISIIIIIIGLLGWLLPAQLNETNIRNYSVKEVKLEYPEAIVDQVSIYKPNGQGPWPAIIFGAGAGADRALYKNWAEGFVSQGFVVLLRSSSYGRKEEKPWIDARDDIINAFNYLKKLDYVDQNKMMIGGHSASANLAYWVAHKIPEEIKGIVAIAGRYPPKDKGRLKTEIFLGTGAQDDLVPPEKIYEVAGVLSGQTNYDQDNSDNITVYISEGSNHLLESWDNNLIRAAVKWSAGTVGNQYGPDYTLEKINIRYLSIKLISALLFFIGAVYLTQKYLYKRYSKNIFINILTTIVYFLLFYLVWSTTVSKYLFYFGPFNYKWPKYLIITIIVMSIGLILSYLFKDKEEVKYWGDLLFILSSLALILIIFSFLVYLPPFSYGGSIIFFKVLIVLLPIIVLGYILKRMHLLFYQRIIFYSLSFVWLLTAVLPPK